MRNEDFKPEQNNKPEEKEQRAMAKRLEKAMKFEARPEFNAELRNRLMSNLPTQKQLVHKNRHWPSRLVLQGWRTTAAAFVLVLLSLGIFFNSNLASPGNNLTTIEATPNIQENTNYSKFDQNPVSAQVVKSERTLKKQLAMEESPAYESSLQYNRLLKKENSSAPAILASANDDKAKIKIIQY